MVACLDIHPVAIQIAEMDNSLADSLSRNVTSLFTHRNWRPVYKAPQSYRLWEVSSNAQTWRRCWLGGDSCNWLTGRRDFNLGYTHTSTRMYLHNFLLVTVATQAPASELQVKRFATYLAQYKPSHSNILLSELHRRALA